MGTGAMKILVLESSGNKNGSSNLLAKFFIKGAEEAGNEVTVFDVIHSDIRPCLGCNHCGMAGACVQQDDYENTLKDLIRATDMIVFVMPVYYYNWPSRLKTVVDRFYSFTYELTSMHKKTVLLSAAWDSSDTVFAVVEAYYRQLCSYMEFEDMGMVLGKGCGTPSMTASTKYPEEAYVLGKNIKMNE